MFLISAFSAVTSPRMLIGIDRLEPVANQIEDEYPDAVAFGADGCS